MSRLVCHHPNVRRPWHGLRHRRPRNRQRDEPYRGDRSRRHPGARAPASDLEGRGLACEKLESAGVKSLEDFVAQPADGIIFTPIGDLSRTGPARCSRWRENNHRDT